MTVVKPYYVTYYVAIFCFSLDPFVVAFVDTMYTVPESIASMTVCVNLTQPQIDILDETVNVFVMDNPSSVYIPADAPLASESEYILNTAFFSVCSSSPCCTTKYLTFVRALCLDKDVKKGFEFHPRQQFLFQTKELSWEQVCCLPFLYIFLPLFRISTQ